MVRINGLVCPAAAVNFTFAPVVRTFLSKCSHRDSRHPESGLSRKAFKGHDDSWSQVQNGMRDDRRPAKTRHSKARAAACQNQVAKLAFV